MTTEGHRAYLSLGSNVNAESNLRSALLALRDRFERVRTSPAYRTKAVGFAGDDFLNLAAIVESDMDAVSLNDWLHALEEAHGRRRNQPRYSSRPLDIDIVFFDRQILQGPDNLQIPRPELVHAFVLKPLCDLAPDYIVPGIDKTLAQLWAEHDERNGVVWNCGSRFLEHSISCE